MDIPVSFGEWVKRRRRMLDLTQKELAQRAGCSVAALQKIERDERRPSRQLAGRLLDFLEVSPEQKVVLLKIARRERTAEALPPLHSSVTALPKESDPPRFRSELSLPAAPLVGREAELAEITRLFDDPHCRLLTLTGSGGVGKTRLALEAARQIQTGMANGACFVSLVGVSAPEFIVPAIAEALGFILAGQTDSKLQLFNFLREKQILIVLDNFEHLLDGTEILGEILQQAPGVKLLVTSRELLHLQTEWMLEVHGLAVPRNAQADELESSSAARLFLQRARQAHVGFTLSSAERIALLHICQLVQGLPLAIELAAAWVRTLSCREIEREITRGLSFLSATARDIPERHRSMTAVFEQSWKLLSAEEQRILRQLSVFRGGFTREAAEQVTGAKLRPLSALVDKSLVQHNEPQTGRFELHELIRQFAAAHLQKDLHEERQARASHAQYYLGLLQKHDPALRNRRQKEAFAELRPEIDNLRVAWAQAVSSENIDLLRVATAPQCLFYELHQYFQEGETLFEVAAEMVRTRLAMLGANISEPEKVHLEGALGTLLAYQAFFDQRLGRNDKALTLYRTGIALLRPLPEKHSLSFALIHCGVVSWATGDFWTASRDLNEGLLLSQEFKDRWHQTIAFGFLGMAAYDTGDTDNAKKYLREAIAICRETGDPHITMLIGILISRMTQAMDVMVEAQDLLRVGFRIAQETGNRWAMGLGLEQLAILTQAEEDYTGTRSLLAESIVLHREVGDLWSLSRALNTVSRLILAQQELVEAEQYAREAARVAAEAGYHPNALDALATLAAIKAAQGQNASALEMALQILHHPSSTQDARERAAHLRHELGSDLTSDRLEEVRTPPAPDMLITLAG
ncbi:MAG TPA: helix-turn-helix domain-containing protein [Anaerolineales bacterium]|nr:helix-turn-helix domain-containing protein [Anaerolineales bacterium]